MNLLVSYVAVAQLYCYHYKFVTILSMAKHRTIPVYLCFKLYLLFIITGKI